MSRQFESAYDRHGPWINAGFAANWGNIGGAWQTVQYRRAGNLLYIRGVALRSTSTSGANSTIFTLNAGFRPLADLIIATSEAPAGVDAYGRVEVTSGGVVRTFTSVVAGGHVSLCLPPIWLD